MSQKSISVTALSGLFALKVMISFPTVVVTFVVWTPPTRVRQTVYLKLYLSFLVWTALKIFQLAFNQSHKLFQTVTKVLVLLKRNHRQEPGQKVRIHVSAICQHDPDCHQGNYEDYVVINNLYF